MNTPSKTLLFAILLIAGLTGVVLLMKGGNAPPPLVTPEAGAPEAPAEPPPEALVSTAEHGEEAAPPVERQEIALGGSGAEYAQGAKGRLIDPVGRPLANTKVYLMEGGGLNLIEQMMQANKGTLIPPVARTETDEAGRFALGLARPDDRKAFEIRAVSDQFVDKHVPNIHIAAGEWYDAGDIQLDRGTLLYGRVTIEGSGGMPVPNATVLVKPLNFVPAVSPTPGREEGIEVEVDQTGAFRMENAPAGVVTVAAVAPGYAKVEKTNITVNAAGDNQVLFELPPGVSIGGLVTDAADTPVPNAKIQVTAISSKTPVYVVTRSDENGKFEAIGLVQGHYMLTAAAPGFVPPAPLKPIEAGRQDVHIRLDSQGSAKLKVFDKNSRLMTSYRVTIKKYFAAQDQIASSMIPAKTARTDRDGVFTMDGLNPDDYVFQVEASGHAKAFSQPFKVTLGAPPPLVEVRLNEGGILEGVVLDSRGQPLPGVKVETLPNDLDDNPFTDMFGAMIPYRVTRTETKTDGKGQYRFTLLNSGTYQLRFTHPEHYDLNVKDHPVVDGQKTAATPVTMARGTQITGSVRVDGQPAGQVKVTITAMGDPQVTNPSLFNCNAITGNDGTFTMGKRVPPGRYQVMAARQTLPNPLLQIADYHRSKQEITLGQGQESFFLPITIASQ